MTRWYFLLMKRVTQLKKREWGERAAVQPLSHSHCITVSRTTWNNAHTHTHTHTHTHARTHTHTHTHTHVHTHKVHLVFKLHCSKSCQNMWQTGMCCKGEKVRVCRGVPGGGQRPQLQGCSWGPMGKNTDQWRGTGGWGHDSFKLPRGNWVSACPPLFPSY